MSRKVLLSVASMVVLIAALVYAAAPAGAPTDKSPDAYKGLTAQQVADIKAGKIVILKQLKDDPNTPSGMIEAAMIVKQNITKVWALMVDGVAEQKKYLPYLEESKIVNKPGNHTFVQFYLKIVGVRLDYQVDHVAEKDKFYFHWELDPTYKNKLKTLKGFWQWYYIDDATTLCRYGTWFEIGIGVPKSVQTFLIQRDLPESLDNVQKFINSGGTWRKSGYAGKD